MNSLNKLFNNYITDNNNIAEVPLQHNGKNYQLTSQYFWEPSKNCDKFHTGLKFTKEKNDDIVIHIYQLKYAGYRQNQKQWEVLNNMLCWINKKGKIIKFTHRFKNLSKNNGCKLLNAFIKDRLQTMSKIPFAITNQPWLLKHIMSYHHLSYLKKDKFQHKNKLNKLHKELNQYHWLNFQLQLDDYIGDQPYKYSYIYSENKCLILGKKIKKNSVYTWEKIHDYLSIYNCSQDPDFFKYKNNFPGIESDELHKHNIQYLKNKYGVFSI